MASAQAVPILSRKPVVSASGRSAGPARGLETGFSASSGPTIITQRPDPILEPQFGAKSRALVGNFWRLWRPPTIPISGNTAEAWETSSRQDVHGVPNKVAWKVPQGRWASSAGLQELPGEVSASSRSFGKFRKLMTDGIVQLVLHLLRTFPRLLELAVSTPGNP